MKRNKSILSLIFAVLIALNVSGCLGLDPYADPDYGLSPLEVSLQIYLGENSNTRYIHKVVKDFKQEYSSKKYTMYTKGVDVIIYEADKPDFSKLSSSDMDIVISDGAYTTSVKKLADRGHLASINDIVYEKTDVRLENGDFVKYSIDDKIAPAYKEVLKGSDGRYYALPSSGVRQGIVYDINTFERYGLYLADPATANDQNSYLHEGVFGSARFLIPLSDQVQNETLSQTSIEYKKTCGNDGIFGTWDDGTPSSLQEFFILCDYMKKMIGISPLTYDASNLRAKEYLYNALFASLAGSQNYQTIYSFDGQTEIVTGETQQNAFEGINYIKIPKTESITLTKENGYHANSNVNRYWAMSALKVAETEGWYSSVALDTSNNRKSTIFKFLLNGVSVNGEHYPPQAMLLENDRWYNAYKEYGDLEDAFSYLYDEEFKLGWMSMPTKVMGSVAPNENLIPNPYFEYQGSADIVVINAFSNNDDGVIDACKDFLKFLYSDQYLSLYSTQSLNFKNGMDYTLTPDDEYSLDYFQQQMYQSYASVTNRVAPIITNLYNYDVDYFYNPYADEGLYLGEQVTKYKNVSLYEMFMQSCTDLDEWEILKAGKRFQYIPIDPEPEIDPDAPVEPPEYEPGMDPDAPYPY